MRLSILTAAALALTTVAEPLVASELAATGSSAELPTAVLPPELDRVLRDYERLWRAGDTAALAQLFTEDGWVLASGRPPVQGRAAIQAAYAEVDGGPLRLRAIAYGVEGATGFILGAFGYGDAPGDSGKFTLTLRRAPEGRWLIVSDMDNGNRPPRCPDPPAASPAPAHP